MTSELEIPNAFESFGKNCVSDFEERLLWLQDFMHESSEDKKILLK